MHARILLSLCQIATLPAAASWAAEGDGAKKSAPLSFGVSRTRSQAKEFGATNQAKSAEQRTTERDKAYARGLMRKYDRNKNRVLEKDEWQRIRGNPEKADTNGDGRITYDELVNRIMRKRRETEATETAKKDEDAPKSYRIATPAEKLPDDLPSWFKEKDANRDGQVAMHEYARRWNDSTARRFVGLDKNDDGVITAEEAASK